MRSALTEKSAIGVVRRLRNDSRGVAAIEFSFIALFLMVGMLNACELAVFLFDRLQTENAAEMGVQAVWANCDMTHTPATNKCTNWTNYATTGVQSTALGTNVHVASGFPTEGYYCVNSSGALQYMADVNNKPADCTGAGVSTNAPADYIKVQVTYTYTPMFTFTVGSLLPATMTETASMRLV